jgi:hypothetical protein
LKPLADLSDDALAQLTRQSVRDLPDAPHWLVESAVALWRAPTQAPSALRRLTAVLGFDSWAATPALALRSASPGARQWLFSAGEHDIDLRVGPVEGSTGLYKVTGQLLGPGDDVVVRIGQDNGTSLEVKPDEFGEFQLGPLAANRYVMTVQVADELIELPEIDVGGEAPL